MRVIELARTATRLIAVADPETSGGRVVGSAVVTVGAEVAGVALVVTAALVAGVVATLVTVGGEPLAAPRGPGTPAGLAVILVVLVVIVVHRRHTEVGLDLMQSAHPCDPSGAELRYLCCGTSVRSVTGVTTQGDVKGRWPINAVPTRTHVEPCRTAASRSSDIPADS